MAYEPEPAFETFAHGAQIGVRGRGARPAGAFANAARALVSLITDLERVAPSEEVRFELAASDPDFLLFSWIEALLHEMEARDMVFSDFEVEIADGLLRARARGEALDPARHRLAARVQGPRLEELAVRREADGTWLAQCVVDL